MEKQKTVLLASFISRNSLEEYTKSIKENFIISGSKIFILKDKNDDQKIILTYNINLTNEKIQFDSIIPETITLHRKKESNTLYTLNALNLVVQNENNGKLDKSFQVPWKKYLNCILITQKKNLIKIETELENILEFKEI